MIAVALGTLLRCYGLGREGYWGDEAISVDVAHLSAARLIADRAHSHNPPLYFFILRAWIALFGDGEAATRSLSALFGALALPAIYLVGRDYFSARAGVMAAFLLAISPLHLRYSQETRAYSLVVLLALLSFLLFRRALREGRPRHLAGLLVLNALLVYTHFAGWLPVLVQSVAFLLAARGGSAALPSRRWWWLQGGLLLAVAPWGAALAFSMSTVMGRDRPVAAAEDLPGVLGLIAGSLAGFALAAAVAALGAGRARLAGIPAGPPFGRLERLSTGLWLLGGMVAPVVLSLFLPVPLRVRYLIAGLPPLLLLAGAGIDRFGCRAARGALLAALLLTSGVAAARQYRDPVRQQWREAFRTVAQGRAPGDLVLLTGIGKDKGTNAVGKYYFGRAGVPLRRARGAGQFQGRRAPKRVWTVVSSWGTPKSKAQRLADATLAALEEGYSRRRTWPYLGIEVRLYEKAGP